MSYPSYMPVEKYEMHSLPAQFNSASESQTSVSYAEKKGPPMDAPDEKSRYNRGNLLHEMAQRKPKRPSRLSSALGLLKALLMPILAIVYLTFCYVVHYRVVPISLHGIVNTSPQNIASIKAGVTSISILIVALGLWPLRELILNLRSEEFFRVVSTHRPGVPISVANSISNPSFSNLQSLKVIIQRHCTPFLTAAVAAGGLAMATSTLAPAALTVQSVLFDSNLQAFAVGAVGPQSVFNASDTVGFLSNNLSSSTGKAASIAYVETSVGVTYNFAPRSDSNTTSYIIPTPSELATTTNARWLSDVVTINPSCSFAKTNVTQTFSFDPSNNTALPFSLPDAGIELVISSTDGNAPLYIQYRIVSYQGPQPSIVSKYATINYIKPTTLLDSTFASTELQNQTTKTIPSDGSSAWVLTQCIGSGCEREGFEPAIYLDLSGLPIVQGNIPNGTIQFAFLHCNPHPTIATHEIRSDGKGTLTVQPDNGRSFSKQGNLNPTQVGMLLSAALSDFTTNAGPPYSIIGFGPQAQAEFVLGKDQVAKVNLTEPEDNAPAPVTTLAPQALSDITAVYTTMAQGAAKVYMTGALGTAYVPGRINTSELVFDSSLPHVIVSTFLFVVLSLLVIVAHFRSGKDDQFTLFGVAAALHESRIPAQFAQMKADEGLPEDKLIQSLGSRLVSLTRNEDGSLSLRLT